MGFSKGVRPVLEINQTFCRNYPGTGYFGVTKFVPNVPQPSPPGRFVNTTCKSIGLYIVCDPDSLIEVRVDFDKKTVQFQSKEEKIGELMSFSDFAYSPILLASICNPIQLDIVFPSKNQQIQIENPKSEKNDKL